MASKTSMPEPASLVSTAAGIGPITEAMLHCFGIGPKRRQQLYDAGVHTWHDVLNDPAIVPHNIRHALTEESRRCCAALEAGDLTYFLGRFAPQDKWRILTHFREQAAYFDIETTGLEYDASITVICCWHRGELHTFVEHENLDQFLDLLDEIELLVSFNGATFDVPRVLAGFHIPELPCPHLDLRWPCYHQGYRGGLKTVAETLGLQRPLDLQDADGALAVRLWQQWIVEKDSTAREHLIRYCASDVLLLALVGEGLNGGLDDSEIARADIWKHLPGRPIDNSLYFASSPPHWGPPHCGQAAPDDIGEAVEEIPIWSPPTTVGYFGSASPSKIRAHRRRE
jgi:uncharacterized protein YprB with RNaseH-like and TPR domain